jgi:hypothetical protein
MLRGRLKEINSYTVAKIALIKSEGGLKLHVLFKGEGLLGG